MNSFYDKAGERIRALREINRYTRETFAEIADISPKFLYEIETGQKGFSADTLYRIAQGLSVNCEYILTGDESNDSAKEIKDTLALFNPSQRVTLLKLLHLIYELSTKN